MLSRSPFSWLRPISGLQEGLLLDWAYRSEKPANFANSDFPTNSNKPNWLIL